MFKEKRRGTDRWEDIMKEEKITPRRHKRKGGMKKRK